MRYFAENPFLISFALASIAMLAACGGGGDSTAAADVVTVMKTLPNYSMSATKEVALMVNATGVNVLDIKCVRTGYSGDTLIAVGIPEDRQEGVVLSMSSADADKAKTFDFFRVEKATLSTVIVPCN